MPVCAVKLTYSQSELENAQRSGEVAERTLERDAARSQHLVGDLVVRRRLWRDEHTANHHLAPLEDGAGGVERAGPRYLFLGWSAELCY